MTRTPRDHREHEEMMSMRDPNDQGSDSAGKTLEQAMKESMGTQSLGKGIAPAAPEHIMQFFAFGHLPPTLQLVSEPFFSLAEVIVANLPRNPERTVALRKLLEAKDAAVRAFIAQ